MGLHVARIRSGRDDARRLVVLDDGRRFQVNAEALPQLTLEEGIGVDDALLARLAALDARYRAREGALKLLGYRLRSRRELRGRLRTRGFSEELVDEVLDGLNAAGLLDDRRFARAWAEQRRDVSQAGPHRVRAELRAKGVRASIVEEAVLATFDQTVEDGTAATVAERYLRRLAGAAPEVRLRRLTGALRRRGFSAQTIVPLITRLAAQGIVRFPTGIRSRVAVRSRTRMERSRSNASDNG